MKKVLLIICMLLGTAICYPQEFLHSKSYIYGVGETDEDALVSLSRSISVQINSESTYNVTEDKRGISEEYNRNSTVSSSVNLVGISHCLYKDGLYYRYICKDDYLSNAEQEYHSYIKKTIELYGTNCKHEPNLILGCYYLAYCAVDNELSQLLGGEKFRRFRDGAKEMARNAYLSSEYGWLMLEEPNTSINRTYVKICGGNEDYETAQPANLFGFEYELDGKWVESTFFLERAFCTDTYSKSQNNDDKAYKMCSIVGIPKKSYYRLLYEIYEDGRYVKLDVPDDWYFKKYVMARLF